jgi:tRNA nucleotidyltransferase (CCA-adding enzyme)
MKPSKSVELEARPNPEGCKRCPRRCQTGAGALHARGAGSSTVVADPVPSDPEPMTELPDPPHLVRRVVAACAAAGGRALLVGGCVRDHLLDLPVKDWDLEVFGLDTDTLERVLRSVGRVDTVGRAFSVFKLHTGSSEVDVSIPRRDSKAGPGHRGILALGDPTMTAEEAVRRRDLTINAILLDLTTGEIVDPANGRADLANGLLRPVDDATFLEDPLRALRAVQFAARFRFRATSDLEALCAVAALDELPPERLLGEWVKLLAKGRQPSLGLDLARRTGILGRLFPAHPHPTTVDAALDRAAALRDRFGEPPRQLAFLVAVWLARLPTPDATDVLDRLRLFRWAGGACREPALAALAQLDAPHTTDADLRWLSTRAEVELTLSAREAIDGVDLGDARQRAAALGVLHGPPPRLLLGRHLAALGVPGGPSMGRVLDAVYAAQLDGAVTTEAEALADARCRLG